MLGTIFLSICLFIVVVLFLHHLFFGSLKFSHEGNRIYFFSKFKRIIHQLAGISFVLLVPSGIIVLFRHQIGKGLLTSVADIIHSYSTILFIIAILPMFFMWVKKMLPSLHDFSWFAKFGGYLSKEKQIIYADKFNAGQKIWFWVSSIGGLFMIVTGGLIFFRHSDLSWLIGTSMSPREFGHFLGFLHIIGAIVITGFLIIHLYMSLVAIKGSIYSIISGFKSEEEVKYMHNKYYQDFKKNKTS